MKRQKVVIIGHGYTSRLGIIRSLGKLDCDITVIAMVFNGFWGRLIRLEGGKPIDCCSKYVNSFYYCNVKDGEGLIDLLLKKCVSPLQKVILIPDSDFSAAVIDNNREKLKEFFIIPNINGIPGQIEHWMNKVKQKDLAREIGLNVAEGVVIPVKNRHFEIPETIKYPCFTKALATISGGKRFLKYCKDRNKLYEVLQTVSEKYETEVLVEEFKHIDKEFAVVGFSDGNNVFIPGVIEFVVNSYSHFGIAREGIIMPPDGLSSVIDQFKSYVKSLGFSGLFDIDFYESDGTIYFGEINLRFGGSGYSVTAMGVNLPEMMVKYYSGLGYKDIPESVKGKAKFINERMCLDDYIGGFISKKEYRKILDSGDIHFIFDESDPGPQIKFNRYYYLQKINKLRRKILH